MRVVHALINAGLGRGSLIAVMAALGSAMATPFRASEVERAECSAHGLLRLQVCIRIVPCSFLPFLLCCSCCPSVHLGKLLVLSLQRQRARRSLTTESEPRRAEVIEEGQRLVVVLRGGGALRIREKKTTVGVVAGHIYCMIRSDAISLHECSAPDAAASRSSVDSRSTGP